MDRPLSPSTIRRLRRSAAQRLARKAQQRPRLVAPDPPPRYDDIWREGIAALEPEPDPDPEPLHGVLRVVLHPVGDDASNPPDDNC